MRLALGGRAAGLAVMVYLAWCIVGRGLAFERWPGSGVLGIVGGANFFFHEAGHLVFMFFGEFLTVLGGSLSQVLIPLVCTVQFVRQRHFGAAAATLFWTGESLTGVALYAADARVRRLPLHGDVDGSGGNHDWAYLLSRTGLLERADLIGGILFALALALVVAALAMLALECLRLWQRPERAQELPEV
jgi:hypothetical protein